MTGQAPDRPRVSSLGKATFVTISRSRLRSITVESAWMAAQGPADGLELYPA
jgi:hypothetical protein